MSSFLHSMTGYKLIEDFNLVVPDGVIAKYVNRTFKERFFTKLYGKIYSPFRKERLLIVTRYKPDEAVYKMGDRIVGHPITLQLLKKEFVNM